MRIEHLVNNSFFRTVRFKDPVPKTFLSFKSDLMMLLLACEVKSSVHFKCFYLTEEPFRESESDQFMSICSHRLREAVQLINSNDSTLKNEPFSNRTSLEFPLNHYSILSE